MYEKYVLVTGGAGFIGSHIVINLVEKYPDYYVINLDKLDYVSNLKNLDSIEGKPNYKFIQGDITDTNFMRKLFLEERVDSVIHCAAKSHVEDSFINSLEFTHNNVLGTHILLNAAFRFGKIDTFLHVSTDEVYGGKSESTVNYETSIRQPTNPYAATKAAAECIVLSYWESFKFPVLVARMNNVYGPHQHPEKVIPRFIELLKRERTCSIHGDGQQVRSFLFVTDAAEALILLMQKGKAGEIYNIGSDFEITMKELAVLLCRKILKINEAEALKYMEHVKDRPFNDLRYFMDCSKIKELGWSQRVNWDQGLTETIKWHFDHPEQWSSMEDILLPFAEYYKSKTGSMEDFSKVMDESDATE